MAEFEEQLPPGVPEYTQRVTEPKLRKPPFWAVAAFLVLGDRMTCAPCGGARDERDHG